MNYVYIYASKVETMILKEGVSILRSLRREGFGKRIELVEGMEDFGEFIFLHNTESP